MTDREKEVHKRIREAEREWAREKHEEQEGPFRGEEWTDGQD